MKRRNIIVVLVVTLSVIALTIGVTFAYFIAQTHEQTNTVDIGYNRVSIVEDFSPPNEQVDNTVYKKTVSVQNNGTVDCFVRVYMDFSNSEIRDISFLSSSENLDNPTFYSAKRVSDNTSEELYINHLPENWVFVSDNDSNTKLSGYYYYTEPVKKDEITIPLFNYVKTDYTDASDKIQQYDIIVYAESVQTIGENSVDFSNEADGWKKAWSEFLE